MGRREVARTNLIDGREERDKGAGFQAEKRRKGNRLAGDGGERKIKIGYKES